MLRSQAQLQNISSQNFPYNLKLIAKENVFLFSTRCRIFRTFQYFEVENIYLNFYYCSYRALCRKVAFFNFVFNFYLFTFYETVGLSAFLKYKETENINYLMK